MPADLDLLQLAATARASVSGLLDGVSHQYALADARLAAGVSDGLVRRTSNWVLRLHAYEQFWNEHGRAPRERTRDITTLPDDERRLGEWAGRQRRFEHGLTYYQRTRLDVSPAFDWDPWDAQWKRNIDACRRSLDETGRLPNLGSAAATEHALARWLGRQLRASRSRALEPHRRAAVVELLRAARQLHQQAGGQWAAHRGKRRVID